MKGIDPVFAWAFGALACLAAAIMLAGGLILHGMGQ